MSYTAHHFDELPSELLTTLRQAASTVEPFCLLETGQAHGAGPEQLNRQQFLAAGGLVQWHRIPRASSEAWETFAAAWRKEPTWCFGVMGYEMRHAFEAGMDRHEGQLQEDMLLFQPLWVVDCGLTGEVLLHLHDQAPWATPQLWWEALQSSLIEVSPSSHGPVNWESEWTEAKYLKEANDLTQHMQRGDIYEVNLCTRHQAKGLALNPVTVYQDLFHRADAPMSGLFAAADHWLISASPERYIQLAKSDRGMVMSSQPIKGTAARFDDVHQDALSANSLRNSLKEQAENIMIVDLVRNDLSRVAEMSTVTVPRLLEVRTLPTVHHLVSTVEGLLREGCDWLDAIAASFPMGSMTGAPKVSAMHLIQSHESSPRGWYSGALGYVRPSGECDWNVIIRSLVHHAPSQAWETWAGSALTLQSDLHMEWEECALKTHAVKASMQSQPS